MRSPRALSRLGLRCGLCDWPRCLSPRRRSGLAAPCTRMSSDLPDDHLRVLRREHHIAVPIDERGAGQVVVIQEEGPVHFGEVDAVVARGRRDVVRVGVNGYGEDLYGLDV